MELVWLLALVIMFWRFWKARQELLKAKSWLITKGHLTHYELIKAGHSVWPKIEYTYQVHDKDLVGEYLFLDTSHNSPHSKYSRQIAYKAAMAFKENAEIDVFYNPNHPEQSALDITIPKKLNFILIFISALIVLHLGLIAYRYFVLTTNHHHIYTDKAVYPPSPVSSQY